MEQESTLHKYARWFFSLALTVLGCVLAVKVLPRLLVFFMPFVIGWIIALLAAPLVRFARRKLHMTGKLVSGIFIVVVILIILGILYGLGSLLFSEIVAFVPSLPGYVSTLSDTVSSIGAWLRSTLDKLPESLIESAEGFVDNLKGIVLGWAGDLGSYITSLAGKLISSIPNAIIYVILTVLSSFFLITERDNISTWLRTRTPAFIREKMPAARAALKKAVGGYLMAQIKIMGLVAVIILIGLLILRVSYAFAISLITAFIDALPVFGSGFILWPWALVKILSGDILYAVGLLAIYAAVQILRQFLQPRIMGDSIGLSPLATLFFFYIGFRFYGVGGMILAAPVGMIIVELYRLGLFNAALTSLREMAAELIELIRPPKPKEEPPAEAGPEEPEVVPAEAEGTAKEEPAPGGRKEPLFGKKKKP